MTIIETLKTYEDLIYKEFQCALMPTVPKEKVIGVRIPALRALAKQLRYTSEAQSFLDEIPHQYYEEDNLHCFLLEHIKDYDECLDRVEKFLPNIDNWATCDSLNPKIFAANRDKLLPEIRRWIKSDNVYTVRFAIGMLMRHYLNEAFDTKYIDMVSNVESQEYYINMMIAWYFATALSKQYECAISVIENQTLSVWVHNKSIQKAIESRRITDEQKAYLRTLRR